jgi:acetoacetyl-CoA reductase
MGGVAPPCTRLAVDNGRFRRGSVQDCGATARTGPVSGRPRIIWDQEEASMSRVALVTGGTRGIGAAISTGLKAAGYTVAAGYGGDDAKANAFKDETGIAVYKFDVSDYDAVAKAVQQIETDLGPIEVLVNNAGITRDGTMHKMTPDQWQAVIDTNLGSCFNCSRAVIEGMRSRKFGRIVNIGSINGQAGQYGQVNYAAAKSGIHGFTKALAQEGAKAGITVNAIAPGYIDTDMVRAVPQEVLDKIVARIPVGRLGQAAEIARGVLFLVADDAGFVTGSTLSINGGQHMY